MDTANIRSACAKVNVDGKHLATAFLISNRYAITSVHLIIDSESKEPKGEIELEFPLRKFKAKVEAYDFDLHCAVLTLDEAVEDVLPVTLGVDAAFGDTGILFGFPKLLEGTGVFIDGQIQDATFMNETFTSILMFPLRNIEDDIFNGFSGAPLVVNKSVVGFLTRRYSKASGPTAFLIFNVNNG